MEAVGEKKDMEEIHTGFSHGQRRLATICQGFFCSIAMFFMCWGR